ncbi:flavin-dependent oxidoreductase [Novosphingobium sp. KCTC 2891]|uniref:flavin-dependent oxidoreductase n=1 Tax=Novosphingobium sp. KCTC 2891 TaxID=2989730 RepID=UPI002222CFFF|nr:flavin-dependent oxidoreductase [Novosphingobium sp. KCTC 2891]MCW1384913.1 flavin-dependent oxidoreductase [Novosphingobium sp. KCTC 2891]
MDRTLDIAIAGGGIVGLTAALSLHAAGFKPVVYEAVRQPAPLGVGINLLPHAVRELTELGLLDELLGLGVAIEDLNYLTSGGELVWHEPRGLVAGYAWPQIAIHRGALQMFLLDKVRQRLGPQAVRMGQELAAVATIGQRAQARFVDRASGQATAIEADVLIGADGIHSAVRRQFYPDEGSPRWNGITLWRSTSLVRAPMGGKAMIWAGRSAQKFVAYPIGRDAETGLDQLNWICDLKVIEDGAPPPRDWNRLGNRADFLPRFADWRWAGVNVPEIVNASGPIYEFPMIDRDPVPQWTFGRATLMGDAAHPMYPIGSNGATQGIIDARVFAWHLARAGSVEEALRGYEADRRETTARIVLMNRQQGPDRVLDLAAERLEGMAGTLEGVLPMAEREAIARSYKKTAGFDPAVLNASPSYSVPG